MNIFEYAMKMENDGRDFYLEHAEKVASPHLKKILLELADDEQKHYNIFKAMRDGNSIEYKEAEKTTILVTVKNVFEELRSDGSELGFAEEAKKIWQDAREVEKLAEAFYREKAEELDDEKQKHILVRIADEEHRHWGDYG